MMKVILAIIATLMVMGVYCDIPDAVTYQTNISALAYSGLEIIFLDGPSWATKIQPSYGTHEFFVFGDKTLRTIHSGNVTGQFFAEPDSDPLIYPLIDLNTFFYTDPTGKLYKYTLGVSDFNADDAGRFDRVLGPYLPLFYSVLFPTAASSALNLQFDDSLNTLKFSGFMMYSVHCDGSYIASNNVVIAYYAGFYFINNTSPVTFTLLRTNFTMPTSGLGAGSFDFNPAADVFPIYTNKYTAFSETFKPWIFRLNKNGNTIILIVDPSSKALYAVDVLTGTVTNTPLINSQPGIAYDLVSASFDFFGQRLVVGLSASGINPGGLLLFDFSQTTYPFVLPDPAPYIVLPGNYSNPKALALDFGSGAVYIGLNGDNELLKYNVTTNKFYYQRLPEFLHRSWDATVTIHHVYFVTYEQNSKVFRVNKTDFCDAACPSWGYCSNGKCECSEGFVMNKGKNICEFKQLVVYHKEYVKAHGGEIALGVFFTLAFVAAAAGWFMWYRSRHGAYQAV